MKHKIKGTVKALACLVLAVMMMIGAVSCSGGDYKDDVKTSVLAEAALAKIPVDGGYTTADADYMQFNFPGVEYADDYTVSNAANSSANINEVGILHASSEENATKLFDAAKAYVADKKEAWMNAINYTPNEHPKMENAVCRQFGNYVVYTILTEADSNSVISAIEALIKN